MRARTRRLVLVGGGHAHLEILRRAARSPMTGVEVVLVSPYPRHIYSSTMPAQLRNDASGSAGALHVAALCRSAGGRFVEATADRVEGGVHPVVHVDGERLEADAVSLDIGSVPAALDTPGVREHAWPIRPPSAWHALLERVRSLSAQEGRAGELAVAVVGGGAGGIEIALALAHRLRGQRRPIVLSLIERDARLVPGMSERAAHRLAQIVERAGVRLMLGSEVARVDRDAVWLRSGERIGSSLTVWVSGAAAPSLIASSPSLPRDREGFLLVDATLRAVDGAAVWGGGDCLTLQDAPSTPKSGVIAVRQGPVLAHNLRAALAGGHPAMRVYHPQRHALAILDTSDRRGFLVWRNLTSHSRSALTLKSAIDQRFLRRYRA